MEKALNHTEDVNFPEVVRKGSMSHIGEGELKVKTYEEYLIRFTRSPDYYVEPLLEFLDIKGERKQKLLEMNKRRVFEGSLSHTKEVFHRRIHRQGISASKQRQSYNRREQNC
jgi:hypothetical protein